MFSWQHFVWLAISVLIIAGSLVYCYLKKPTLKQVLTVCCGVCILSELVKIFSTVELVPSSDGSILYPYLPNNQLPFHLCSIQIIFIFIARFGKEGKFKDRLLGFMYPTCIIGALFALFLPSIFGAIDGGVNAAFTHPVVYQTFIYHSMLIILGVWIFHCKKDSFTTSFYLSTEVILLGLSIISIYLNSMFANATYENGELVSVDFVTNFFFTYKTPINLALTAKWQWFVYLLILIALCFVTIGIAYIPVFVKDIKAKKAKTLVAETTVVEEENKEK